MNKKWIPVIVAIIGLLGAGGAVYNIQIGDSTVITDSSTESTVITDARTYVNTLTGEIVGEGALIVICLQNPIPEGYVQACAER